MFRAYVFLLAVILSFAAVPNRSPAIGPDGMADGVLSIAHIRRES